LTQLKINAIKIEEKNTVRVGRESMKTKFLTKNQQDALENLLSYKDFEHLERTYKIGRQTKKEFEDSLLYSPKAEFSDAGTQKGKYQHVKSGYVFIDKKDALSYWKAQREEFCNELRNLAIRKVF
jgi:hypothetical protein